MQRLLDSEQTQAAARHLQPLRAAGDGALGDVQARQPPPRPAIRTGTIAASVGGGQQEL